MSINILKSGSNHIPRQYIYPYIVQIGTGGTGSYVVKNIAQTLGISKKNASYMIVDPDVIEEKNLGNQLFLPEEVGLKKADVLASRYSQAFNIDIASYSEGYIESVEDVKKLFVTEYLNIPSVGLDRHLFLPIIIGCVDNNYTRKILDEFFKTLNTCIYIDAGNESVTVPSDWQERPKSEWTESELKEYNDSGWSGQVVTGVRLSGFKQDPVADAMPSVHTDEDSIRPSDMSCTELTASDPQRLIVNKFAALAITGIFSQILEEDSISTHISFFHAKKNYLNSTPLQKQE